MLWRLLVTSADGTAKDTVNVDDAIASLTDFSVDAAGSCLEASFVAVPSQVDIRARDIITLQTYELTSVGIVVGWIWVQRWKGVVTLAGNPRSHDLQEFRAVGLKQRFYERVMDEAVVEGADVGAMVRSVVSAMTRPAGVTYASAFVPLTVFQLGDRYPMLESVGAFLDFMAESVGAFIVPAGQSYTYNGVTYAAGETVPAVMWGVDGNGNFLFRRPQASSVAVNEGDATTRVTWNGVNAEEFTNRVRLLYLNGWVDASNLGVDGPGFYEVAGNAGGDRGPIAPPLQRGFVDLTKAVTWTAEWAERLVALPNPLDYMATIPVEVESSAGYRNPGNCVDGQDASYAHYSGEGTAYVMVRPQFARPVHGCLWRLRFMSPADAGSHTVWAYQRPGNSADIDTPTSEYFQLEYVIGEGSVAREAYTDVYVYVAPPVGWTGNALNYTALSFWSPGSVTESTEHRLYAVECYVPDVDAGERGSQALADGFMRAVPPEVATVEVQSLGAVTQSLDLSPVGAATLAGLRVERISFRITVEDGVVTTYHVGQAFEPDLEAQRIVLERLARKANNNEPVSRPTRPS